MRNTILIFVLIIVALALTTFVNAAVINPQYVPLENVISVATAFHTEGTVRYNSDVSGNKLSILDENKVAEEYDNAMLISGRSVLTYNNIREYGYVKFQADLGINLASGDNAISTFKVIADGNTILELNDININLSKTVVDLDISEYSVIQIVTTGSNMVLGNPQFIKNGNHPTLEVYDIEFSDHAQITEHTLLEYVTSFDVDGTDISNNVTYTTNYKKGVDGNYEVIYKTTGKNGDSYQRTVNISVVQTDNTRELTVDELKKPWANYLYHGRSILDNQGQKVFDLILDTTMDLDTSKYELITRWSTLVYLVPINLTENDIYVSKDEIKNISTHIQDSEGRMYIIPDWGYEFKEKDGLVETVYLWVRKNLQDKRDEDLIRIENNTQNLMTTIKSDMTQAQKFNLITQEYAKWIVYTDGGTLLDSMGYGVGKCNGNSRGVAYLAQRTGIKSVYAEGLVAAVTGGHAWSYQYIPDMGKWYLTDKLWGRILAAPLERYDAAGNPYYEDLSPYFKASFSRMDEYFEVGEEAYPREKFRYPSVWIDVLTNSLILEKNVAYNIKDVILDFGSVYNDVITIDDIDFEIKNTSHTYDLSLGYIPLIKLESDGSDLYKGTYQVTMTLNVNGFEVKEVIDIEVVDSVDDFKNDTLITGSVNKNQVGLYDGKSEVYHDFSIVLIENGEATLDVSSMKNVKYLTFDYGIKDSVRLNTSYGHYASVALAVYIDDVLVHTTKDLGWKTAYETVTIEIPSNASTVKFVQLNKGSGNNHAAIANIKTYNSDSTLEYGEIKRGDEIITQPTETTPGKVEVYCLNSGILLEQTNIYRVTFKQDGKYLSHTDYRHGQTVDFVYPETTPKEGFEISFETINMNQNQVVNTIYTKVNVEDESGQEDIPSVEDNNTDDNNDSNNNTNDNNNNSTDDSNNSNGDSNANDQLQEDLDATDDTQTNSNDDSNNLNDDSYVDGNNNNTENTDIDKTEESINETDEGSLYIVIIIVTIVTLGSIILVIVYFRRKQD